MGYQLTILDILHRCLSLISAYIQKPEDDSKGVENAKEYGNNKYPTGSFFSVYN